MISLLFPTFSFSETQYNFHSLLFAFLRNLDWCRWSWLNRFVMLRQLGGTFVGSISPRAVLSLSLSFVLSGLRGEWEGRTAGEQISIDPFTDSVPLHCKTWQSELCRLCFVHWGGEGGVGLIKSRPQSFKKKKVIYIYIHNTFLSTPSQNPWKRECNGGIHTIFQIRPNMQQWHWKFHKLHLTAPKSCSHKFKTRRYS